MNYKVWIYQIVNLNIKLVISIILLASPVNIAHSNIISDAVEALTDKQKNEWNKMLGRWYGSTIKNNGRFTQWIIERSENGIYRVIFKNSGGSGEDIGRIEAGRWGISGDIYFTFYEGYWIGEGDQIIRSDTSDPYNYDAYKILELTKDRFVYEHVRTKAVFTVDKVDKDFWIEDME